MAENNTKVMRDALLKVSSSLCPACRRRNCKGCPRAVAEFMPAVRKALALPLRQCDVGTAKEQAERFKHFCAQNYSACDVDMECCRCPIEREKADCEFAWGQLPHKESEATDAKQ